MLYKKVNFTSRIKKKDSSRLYLVWSRAVRLLLRFVVCLSVTLYIVPKRYVVYRSLRWQAYYWIGRW